VRFWSAGHYYGRALRQVVHSCQQLAARRGLPADRFAPFVADVEFPHVQPAAEAFFVARLERLVEDCFPNETLLVVLLTPEVGDGAHELEALNESIVRLSRAAVTPRVKFVVAAHPLDVPAPREELCVATSDVRVDASVIEHGIRERLRMPEVPLIERLRLTMALSSFTLARDEPEVALPLGLEAFQLAQETGSAEEVLLTRYALAGHLYRCGALDQASEAYADVLASAIDRDNRVLAAQALVGLGHCQFMLRQYDRAIHSYGVARTYFAKLGQHVSEAYAITWRAESLAHMNDLTQAEHDFHEALLACGRAGQGAESSRADILLRLGELYQRQRRTSEAHRYTEAARASGAVAPPSHEP
jgi:tetratricopeptide (TPR) repeat protein